MKTHADRQLKYRVGVKTDLSVIKDNLLEIARTCDDIRAEVYELKSYVTDVFIMFKDELES